MQVQNIRQSGQTNYASPHARRSDHSAQAIQLVGLQEQASRRSERMHVTVLIC